MAGLEMVPSLPPLPLAEGVFSFGFLAPLGIDLLILMTLAVSLNLINGCAGLFSLGHQGFFGVGAYAAGLVFVTLRPVLGEGGAAGGLGLALSVLAGGLAAVGFGLVVGIPCLRLKGDYLAIATLGFAEIFRIAMVNFDRVGGPAGFRIPYAVFTQGRSEKVWFFAFHGALALALLGLALWIVHNIMRSSHGRAIYAIREDEVAAEILGVDLTRYKVTVFATGAGLAGLAGGLFAHAKTYFTPNDFGLIFGVTILLYVVLGGLGSLWGCLVATFALFGLEQALNQKQDILGTWVRVIFALLLIGIVLVRPQGIAGKRSV